MNAPADTVAALRAALGDEVVRTGDAIAARYRIRDLTLEEPDIEQVVRRIYEEGLS